MTNESKELCEIKKNLLVSDDSLKTCLDNIEDLNITEIKELINEAREYIYYAYRRATNTYSKYAIGYKQKTAVKEIGTCKELYYIDKLDCSEDEAKAELKRIAENSIIKMPNMASWILIEEIYINDRYDGLKIIKEIKIKKPRKNK